MNASRYGASVYVDLDEGCDGKLSYAYRFEAPVEKLDGSKDGVTTSEDYACAMKKVNEILEGYM